MRLSRNAAFILGGIGVAALLALFLSPFASSLPDGLERVAEIQGFLSLCPVPGLHLTEHKKPDLGHRPGGSLGNVCGPWARAPSRYSPQADCERNR